MTKPLSEFYPKEGSFTSRCKECERDVCREKMKAKYHADPAAASAAKRKQYAQSESQRHMKSVSCQKWRKNNPDKVKRILKKYYEANKSMFVAARHRRRARLAGNGGSFTAGEWNALLETHNHTCLRCEKKDVKLTADHIIPVAKRGHNDISNIQPLCIDCNKRKFTKSIDYRKGDK